jgi:hypothetical protein
VPVTKLGRLVAGERQNLFCVIMSRGQFLFSCDTLVVDRLKLIFSDHKIKSLESIYLHSLPIKESEIVDYFLKA